MTRFLCALIALLFLSGCAGQSTGLAPSADAKPQIVDSIAPPATANLDASGHWVDSAGNRFIYSDSAGWLISVRGHAATSAAAIRYEQCGSDNTDAQHRSTKDDPCDGAIGAPAPAGENLTPDGNGNYTDQQGSQWSYCDSCTSDTGSGATQGEWLKVIGEVSAGSGTTAVTVNIGDGFDFAPIVIGDALFKGLPQKDIGGSIFFFKYSHFWEQHLACHLKSTPDQFYDALAANQNELNLSGQGGSSPFGAKHTFVFNDQGTAVTITYSVFRFDPITAGDYVITTAYIPGAKNC